MPVNKFAMLRYRIIDRAIRGNYPSKEDLRQACEDELYGSDGVRISASTIDKDIWAMRNEGELGYYAPIKFSKDYGGYFYENPDYTIAELPLSDEDLNAIRAAAETLYQFRDIPLFQQFDSAIEKIFDRMTMTANENADSEIIQFERVGNYKGSEFLQPIYNACYSKTPIKLQYTKFQSSESKEYQLDPLLLKEYRGRWYLIASDREQNKMRTMSLDRVVGVNEMDGLSMQNIDFISKDFFKYSIGITVNSEEPIDVKLRFSSRIAPYVLTQPLHQTQTHVQLGDGSIEVELKVLNTPELTASLLWFGREVQILEPNTLRDDIKRVLIQCLENYK